MKYRILSAVLIAAMLICLASCKPKINNEALTDTQNQSSAEFSETFESSVEEITQGTTETTTQTTTETTTEIETTQVTTEKETSTKPTTTEKLTEATTKFSTTTAKIISTVAEKTSRKSASFDKSLATSKESKRYVADLKYGVDRIRYVTIYYTTDANGKKVKLGEEETSVFYDRSTYSAGYNDLLPGAKSNRQKYSSYIKEVLRLTNEMRAEKGIAPLTLDEKLTEQANVRAEEVAWSGQHSHTRPNTRSYTQLFIDNGYTKGKSGENIGWYYKTPAEVCAAWKASETHYANIMDPDFTRIGIGVAEEANPELNLCWAQHFYSG